MATGRLEYSGRQDDEKLPRKIGNLIQWVQFLISSHFCIYRYQSVLDFNNLYAGAN